MSHVLNLRLDKYPKFSYVVFLVEFDLLDFDIFYAVKNGIKLQLSKVGQFFFVFRLFRIELGYMHSFTLKYAVFRKLHRFRFCHLLTRGYKNDF